MTSPKNMRNVAAGELHRVTCEWVMGSAAPPGPPYSPSTRTGRVTASGSTVTTTWPDMTRPMEAAVQRRASDDQEAVLIFLAIAIVGLIALAGMVLDDGRRLRRAAADAERRDAASMAATRQLDRYVTDQRNDARTILAEAHDTAEKNGAERASVRSRLVRSTGR